MFLFDSYMFYTFMHACYRIICLLMIPCLYSQLTHHIYVHYICLLAQLSDDVTFGVTGEGTLAPSHETKEVKNTPRG